MRALDEYYAVLAATAEHPSSALPCESVTDRSPAANMNAQMKAGTQSPAINSQSRRVAIAIVLLSAAIAMLVLLNFRSRPVTSLPLVWALIGLLQLTGTCIVWDLWGHLYSRVKRLATSLSVLTILAVGPVIAVLVAYCFVGVIASFFVGIGTTLTAIIAYGNRYFAPTQCREATLPTLQVYYPEPQYLPAASFGSDQLSRRALL